MSELLPRETWPDPAIPFPQEIGYRRKGGGWAVLQAGIDGAGPASGSAATPEGAAGGMTPGAGVDAAVPAAQVRALALPGGGIRLTVEKPGAAAVSLSFAVPPAFQAFGGGERYDALDVRGQSLRYYLENFGLVGGGTYLPIPFIATTLGWGFFLTAEDPAMLHICAPHDPERITIQVEGPKLEIELWPGDLGQIHSRFLQRIGPPQMPEPAFFGIWKAGDWRYQDHTTLEADEKGFESLGLPLGVSLLDAYWSDEVHSFRFDPAKHPAAQAMIDRLAEKGAEVHLWLCPWVVVGTASHRLCVEKGWVIRDAEGNLLTRRPGANPNVVAALIDFSNPGAAAWWAESLRGLRRMGIGGFKTDFGEQLPENALLYSGETGGRAHNAWVRYYLQASIDAFDGGTANMISRSGSPGIRTPVWTGDQTSDFCPKTGLPSAIRAVQSISYCGSPFVGTDIGGYFGSPTPQVFARWLQFAAFTPLFMLHGFGCREPWDMDEDSRKAFIRYARMHLALQPEFTRLGRIAAEGGLPLVRMMPLAFPGTDWRGRNDWDQQFMLGEDLLVAPVAFYGNTRGVWVPEGAWYDVIGQEWISGPQLKLRDVALADVPLFLRKGARLHLRPEPGGPEVILLAEPPALAAAGQASAGGAPADPPAGVAAESIPAWLADWFGPGITWEAPATAG